MPTLDYAPFLYFFAGVTGSDMDAIPAAWRARFGLDDGSSPPVRDYPHAKDACVPGCCCRSGAGPGGAKGLLAAPYSIDATHWEAALRYDRAAVADEAEVEPGVWIIAAKRFDPADIMRRPPLIECDRQRLRVLRFDAPGSTAPRFWYIPCCLPSAWGCLLPQAERIEHGKWRRVPMPAYREIASIAETLYRAECGEAPVPSAEWLRSATCEAFAVNYVITPAELGVLGVLHDITYQAVAGLLTDRQAREAEREARARGDTTVRARQHALWKAGAALEYVPTAADLDLAADKLPTATTATDTGQ